MIDFSGIVSAFISDATYTSVDAAERNAMLSINEAIEAGESTANPDTVLSLVVATASNVLNS